MQTSTSESALSEVDEEEGLASEPDVGADAALRSRRTWLVEQCLAWGGEQRLRLRLTVAFLPGDERFRCTVSIWKVGRHRQHGCAVVWH